MAERTEGIKRVAELVPGIEGTTSVDGNVDQARRIAESAVDVAKQFSEAVIRGDFESAYALCARELRGWMSLNRFVTELQRQDEEWEGKPIDCFPQAIAWVYASEASRRGSNKAHDWPKNTPKANKRALLSVWWTTEKPEGRRAIGRPVDFWVSEEPEGLRIARFQPYRP